MILEKKTNFQFVSSVSLFEGWPTQNIYALLTHVKIMQPVYNQYVFTRGQADTNVYLVYQGEIQLMFDNEEEDIIERISLLRKKPNMKKNLKSVGEVIIS